MSSSSRCGFQASCRGAVGLQRCHGDGRRTGAVAPWATADPPPPSPRAVITEIFFLQIVLSGKPTEGNEGPARPSRLPGALRMRCVRGGSGASGGWRMRGGARRGAAGRACAEGRASPCGVPGARSAAVLRCGLRGPVGAMVSVPVSFPAAGGSAGESGPAVRGGRVPLRRPGG